jgi:hypothetical protein
MRTLSIVCLGLLGWGTFIQSPRLLYTVGADGQGFFADVRAASFNAGVLAILSKPEPAMHVRDTQGRFTEWGRSGQGPGEMIDPIDMAWAAAGVVVLDMGNRRMAAFSPAGRALWTRSLETTWANRIAIVGPDTLLHTLVPMTRERAVVRFRGATRDTVLRYQTSADVVRLEAAGAPGFTVARPFVAQDQWTAVPQVGFAYWAAGSPTIGVFDAAGRPRTKLRIPSGDASVTEADREQWFRSAIPDQFMGRRVFEPIRQEARRTMRFPAVFPPVLALLGSVDGQVWVRRTGNGAGETWEQADNPSSAAFRLPPGRELLGINLRTLIVRAHTADGEPVVEVYERPLR